MNNLDNIIEDVVLKHQSDNTREFFTRVQLCLIDCIEKLNEEVFFDYERIILTQAKSLWTNGNECVFEIFRNFRILVGRKRSSEIETSDQRKNALDVLNAVLLTFEDYEPEEKEERAESFDYCAFFLLNAGMKENDLIATIRNHF